MEWLAGLIAISGNNDDVALVTAQWVAKNITYTTDLLLYGAAEHWSDPRETLHYGAGDCEDFAFLLASLLLNNGVDPSRVRVYIGTANGVGHAWVGYRRQSDDKWINLDATKGWWNSISDVGELPKAYPDETHIYTDADSYITCAYVATLSSEDEYVLSLISTSAALSMPLLTCAAADANHGDIQGTLPLLTASGQRNNFGNAEIDLPLLTANAEINSLVARLAVEFPE